MKATPSLKLLTIVLGILMGIHGVTRIVLGTVDDFGEFLSYQGFPLGTLLAWLITIFELIGAFFLIIGYFVKYVSAWFILQLTMGIILVHFKEGWFVVGAGHNGMEYSVLLIACFAAIGWQHHRKD